MVPKKLNVYVVVGDHHGRAGGSEEVKQEGFEELEQCRREETRKEQRQREQRAKGTGKERREEEERKSFCFGQNVFAQTEIELTLIFRL